MGHFKKVCQSRRETAVNELEVEQVQEINEGELETVSIDSVHLNKNQCLITAKLEMQAGRNTIEIPYKIDTISEGNIMALFILKIVQKYYRRATVKIHKKPHQAKNIQQS